MGALLCIGGNISINIGTNLIKLGQGIDVKKANPESLQLLVGWVLFIFGNGVNFIALSMAPQTLLGSLGSVQFIANLVFLGVYLGETIRMLNVFGTLLVIIGNTIVMVGFSSNKGKEYLLEDLYSMYLRREYQIYVALTVLSYAAFQAIAVNKWHLRLVSLLTRPKTRRTQSEIISTSPVLSSCESQSASSSIEIQDSRNSWSMRATLLSGLAFSASSAMLGTESLVTGKTLSVMLRSYSQGKVIFFHPFNAFNVSFFIVVSFAWFGSMLFWMYRLSLSLVLYDAMFIIPVNQIMWITFSVISGGIYFQEFENVTAGYLQLGIGVLLVLVGVAFLVPEKKKQAATNSTPSPSPRGSNLPKMVLSPSRSSLDDCTSSDNSISIASKLKSWVQEVSLTKSSKKLSDDDGEDSGDERSRLLPEYH